MKLASAPPRTADSGLALAQALHRLGYHYPAQTLESARDTAAAATREHESAIRKAITAPEAQTGKNWPRRGKIFVGGNEQALRYARSRSIAHSMKYVLTLAVSLMCSAGITRAENRSQLWFDQSGTDQIAVGANAVITASGGLTYYGRSEPKPPHGSSIVDVFLPVSSLYVVPHGWYAGGPAPTGLLFDAGGGPANTLIGAGGGGAFFEEAIATTKPAGTLPSGEYDLLLDEHQNLFFEASLDYYLGIGSPAIVVDIPLNAPVPPPTAINALKASAQRQIQSAVQLNADLDDLVKYSMRSDATTLNFVRAYELLKLDEPTRAELIGAARNYLPTRGVVIAGRALLRHAAGMAADPPDPKFAELVVLEPEGPRLIVSDDPASAQVRDFARALDAEQRLQGAILAALEKYQGAQAAQNGRWALVHARTVKHFTALLIAQWQQDDPVIAALRDAIAALPAGFDSASPALVDLQSRLRGHGLDPTDVLALAEEGISGEELSDLTTKFLAEDFSFSRAAGLAALDSLRAANAAGIVSAGQVAAPMDGVISQLLANTTLDRGDPAVQIGGTFTGTAGAPVTFAASGVDAWARPLVFDWDFDGDGEFDDATGAEAQYTFNAAIRRLVGVRVTNSGNRSAVACALLTVSAANAKPQFQSVAPLPSAQRVAAGSTLNFSAAATDPEGSPVTLTWLLDGVQTGTGDSFAFSPAAAQQGVHELLVTASDGGPDGEISHRWVVAVTKPVSLADLQVTMTAPENPVTTGAEFTWEMTVRNAGPSAADGVVLTFPVPAGLTFVRASSSFGATTQGPGTVIWNAGSLPAGSLNTLWVQTTAGAQGSFTGTATATTTAAELNPSDNSASARVRVNAPSPLSADLSLTASIAPAAAIFGGNQTITLTTANTGPDGATGMVLEVQLPETAEFVSSTPAATSSDDGLVLITLPNTASGANAVATIVARPTQAGSGPAQARVLGAQQDPNYANNETSITLAAVIAPPVVSDLTVTQTPPAGTVRAGQPATWHITVTNNGPAPAANVTVVDQLPGGADWRDSDPAPDSLGGGRAAFLAGTLASGASRSFDVTVLPGFAGTAQNTVTVTSDSVDANGATSTSPVTVQPEPTTSANLGAALTSSAATAALNTNFTLTLTVSNAGPDAATAAVADIVLPNGLVFVSATPSQGTAAHSNGVVHAALNGIANGANATVNVVVHPAAGKPLTVLASVSSADRDPVPANDRASITVLGTDPAASVAIIRNLDDPEIPKLQEYLTQMGLASQVFDDEDLTAAQLAAFRLVIWDDLSYAAFGIRPPLIDVLQTVADSGRPLYLIGDDLAYVTTFALTEPAASRWTQLVHLQPTGSNIGAGGMIIVNARHPVTYGPFGLAGNSAYLWDPDNTQATGQAGEAVLGQSTGADSLVSFRDPVTRRKSLTQNELVYTQVPTDADREERRKLFQNGVAWLLAPDPVADVSLSVSAAPSNVPVGSTVRLDAIVTNKGPEIAQQVTLTTTLPAGLAFANTSLAAADYALAGGKLTLAPGSLAAGETVTVSVVLTGEALGNYVLNVTAESASEDRFPADNVAVLPVIVVPVQPAVLMATWQFQDTLAACEPSAPPLMEINPLNANGFLNATVAGRTRRVYHWDGNRSAGQTAGLTLNVAGLLPSDNYSVEMFFRFTEEVGSVRRLIDASNRVNNSGVSLTALSHLQTGAATPGSAIAPPGEFHHAVLTVATGGDVTTYLDGVQQSTLAGESGLNLTASGLLHLFAANLSGAGSADFSDGEIALLRLYEGVLAVNRVAAQAAYPFGPDAPMDALADFSIARNSNGVWSYGYSTTRGTPFLFSNPNGTYGVAAAKIIKTATFNGHIYHLIDQSFWPEAESVAVSLGGHLATVDSAAENDFIYRTFGPVVRAASAARAVSLWIGLSDQAQEGTFQWSSGAPVSYTNWIGGQPQGSAPDEDYTGMALFFGQPGGWHDIVGDDRLGDVTFGVVEVGELPQLVVWSGTAGGPHIVKNNRDYAVNYASIVQPPDVMNFDPSFDGRNAVLRWTAPAGGVYRIAGRFQGIDVAPNGTDVAVLKNGDTATTLFSDYVAGFEMRKPFQVEVTLAMGETMDFSVGIGGNSNYFDSTGVDAVVTPLMLTDDCQSGTDLRLTMNCDPATVAAGEVARCTFTAVNEGAQPAPGTAISFTAPADLELAGIAVSQGTATTAGAVTTARLGMVAAGESASLSVLLRGTAAGAHPLKGQVTSSGSDPAPANNFAEGFLSIGPFTQLVATARTGTSTVFTGEDIVFDLVAANSSGPAASGIVLSVAVPPGATFLSASGGATALGGVVRFPAVDLSPGGTSARQITLRPIVPGTLEVIAMSSAASPSVRPGSGSVSVTVESPPLPAADVRVVIATNPIPPAAGCRTAWTFTVTNHSSFPAPDVTLRTTLPPGVVFVSASATKGTVQKSGLDIVASLGLLAGNGQATVSVIGVPRAAGNTVIGAQTASSSNQPKLLHRWSFSNAAGPATDGTVVIDSTGGADGVVRGANAVSTGAGLTLPGGTFTTQAYVDLPNHLVSPLKRCTFEGWAAVTYGGYQWGAFFEFGSTQPGGADGEIMGPGDLNGGGGDGLDFIGLYSSRETDQNQQRFQVGNSDGGNTPYGIWDFARPTIFGQPIHFVVSVDNTTPGELKLNYWRDGALVANLTYPMNLADLNDVNNWLGRSNFTRGDVDNVPATFDEFRLYEGAFDDAMVQASRALGPDSVASSFTTALPAAEFTASLRSTIAPPANSALCARPVALEIFAAPPQQSYRLEWTANPGRTYWIEYSDSLGFWQLVPDSITAASELENWIDPGPPATSSSPAAAERRYYRVWEVPPP